MILCGLLASTAAYHLHQDHEAADSKNLFFIFSIEKENTVEVHDADTMQKQSTDLFLSPPRMYNYLQILP